jgi:hypothetical protein
MFPGVHADHASMSKSEIIMILSVKFLNSGRHCRILFDKIDALKLLPLEDAEESVYGCKFVSEQLQGEPIEHMFMRESLKKGKGRIQVVQCHYHCYASKSKMVGNP